jgi:hypothetical protein
LNFEVATNQHRWKLSVNGAARPVLEDLARSLKWAWETDNKDPKSYPINTHSVFAEIKTQLSEISRAKLQVKSQTPKPLPAPSVPRCLSDLVAERTIKAVYEDQNDGSYHAALKLAAYDHRKGASAWRKILLAVDAAYRIGVYGVEFIPRPRVHFLHRNLLKIADVVGMDDLTHEGMVEFLDDLCPCGEKHKAETIRKLRKRWTSGKQPKP